MGWCMHCQGPSNVTVTADTGRGHLAHYAACWAHIEQVCARVRHDFGYRAPLPPPDRGDVIDTTESRPALNT